MISPRKRSLLGLRIASFSICTRLLPDRPAHPPTVNGSLLLGCRMRPSVTSRSMFSNVTAWAGLPSSSSGLPSSSQHKLPRHAIHVHNPLGPHLLRMVVIEREQARADIDQRRQQQAEGQRAQRYAVRARFSFFAASNRCTPAWSARQNVSTVSTQNGSVPQSVQGSVQAKRSSTGSRRPTSRG